MKTTLTIVAFSHKTRVENFGKLQDSTTLLNFTAHLSGAYQIQQLF